MAREIPLTRGYFALVDAADFPALSRFKWTAHGREPHVYARRAFRVDGRQVTVSMHRELIDAPPALVVDHINGNTLDNRRSNLRACTHKQNIANQRRRNKPGFKGVRLKKGRWESTIMSDGRWMFLGGYSYDYEAARAYDRAAIEHHGAFASLNFDPKRDWLFPYEGEGIIAWPPAPSQMERAA